ncbi:MAG: cobalamin biosynthesis protein CbiB, partial [Hydrogenophaga sp.]|nr:cobalamin biosynthesis protein CbiB [Hydrogenophaga sp.]
ARFADPNEGVILAATAGAIDVQLGGGATRPQPAAGAAPIEAVRAAEGLPGQPPQLAHLTRVVGLVWRVVVLWLFLLALLTLAHVLG